jgi:parallel beta-helix repeat protein
MVVINLTIMIIQNRKFRIGIAMSIATLFTASLITSCQKDSTVTPASQDATMASNSMTIANTTNSLATTYVSSSPILYNNRSGITISGLSIDCSNGTANCLKLQNCSNIHITNCRFVNTQGYGVMLYNCKNITIDNCFVSNVGFGFYAYLCQTIKVNNNQGLNINSSSTVGHGHFAQFNTVTGGGNQINNNKVENIAGVAIDPHDIINLYKSSGIQGDSIQVIGNWIRGGQRKLVNNDGAAGIVLGDVGGSYQVARWNILVNPGYIGLQAQGGNHIKADHNRIYSSQTPISLLGMSWGNYSGTSSTDVKYAYNQVRWYDYHNNEHSFGQNGTGLTLISNTWGASSISSTILPTTIITLK